MKHFESRLQKTPGIGLLKPEPRITRLALRLRGQIFSEQVKDIPRANFVAALQLEGIPAMAFLRTGLQEFSVPA